MTQAAIFAEAQCRITRPLPEYDPDEEFRCTPEEYENGDKASKTPNAHPCHCRHNGTNYDDLIRELDRSSATDQVVYRAIRDRIEKLLEDAGVAVPYR